MAGLVYASIAIATILYVIGFIMLFKYKSDKVKLIEEELEALNNILDSSDKMINELNNLSDYITTNIEDKSSYLKELLVEAERKINTIKIQTNSTIREKSQLSNSQKEKDTPKKEVKKAKKEKIEKVESESSVEKIVKQPINVAINAYNASKNIKTKTEEEKAKQKNIETIVKLPNESVQLSEETTKTKESDVSNSALNLKEREIFRLKDEGLDTAEIAKRLGIGRGEIELILSFRK